VNNKSNKQISSNKNNISKNILEKIFGKVSSKIPIIFFIFFAIIFLVNFAYIVIANKSWKGVVIDKNIAKNLNYQKVVEQANLQDNLGWKVNFNYHIIQLPNNQNQVNFLVEINQQKNRSQIKMVKITLTTRNNANSSKSLILQPEKNNPTSINFIGTSQFLDKGNWNAHLLIESIDNKIYKDLIEFKFE